MEGLKLRCIALLALLSLTLSACTSVPDGVSPVEDFELNRYLGDWYEIVRLDHPFERGLTQVTANYALRDDGGVEVINRGFNLQTQTWKEAKGKAYFVGEQDVGHLKVSFFGPFYSSYVIFVLDKHDYQYALVSGPNRDYFWILARSRTLEDDVLADLLAQAKELGFATEELIFVEQTQQGN